MISFEKKNLSAFGFKRKEMMILALPFSYRFLGHQIKVFLIGSSS